MSRIKELEDKVKFHKALYYQGKPEISDDEYDRLEEELKSLDPTNSVLNLVGTIVKSTKKIKHDSKMLSLDKKYEIDELESWIGDHESVSVFKIDGVSCSLIYEHGKLALAKTRGDGTFGENITEKVRWMKNIPLSINETRRIEIRGEMYCDQKSFDDLTLEMESLNLEKPKNQRNIVAGLIGRKDHVELNRYINFAAFDLLNIDDLTTEEEKLKLLKSLDFDVPKFIVHKKMKGIDQRISETKDFLDNGNYLIDGLVLTYNNLSLHSELGSTAHHPRYRMAFKFRGESKVAQINDIVWSVSRNGILTPVAEIEPTELSGAMISRVTLHNYGVVKEYKLKKGDKIEVIRSGEVIPKFISKIENSKNKYSVPSKCPSCETTLEEVDIRLICENEVCPGKLKEVILNYIQKIGIDDLSTKRLDEMISQKLVGRIEDLYKLDMDKLLTLNKTKEKLAQKILDSVNNSKDVNLITFLSALGIQGGAINKCEKVVMSGFNTIDKILKLKQSDLEAIEGFAEKSAYEFVNSLKKKTGLINNLIDLGVKINKVEIIDKSDSAIAGKIVCITGSLSRKRSEIEKFIKENGGKTSGSVSKKTDYLLTNDKSSTSSKFKKAQELGIQIIDEESFFQLIK